MEMLLLERSPDLLLLIDGGGRVVCAAGGPVLGLPAAELVGRALTDFFTSPERAIAESVCRQPGVDLRLKARRADGSPLVAELRTRPREGDGTFALALRDVTALDREEQELRRTNENLRSFASTAAHDLKSPLNTIKGFSQLVLSRYAGVLGTDGRRHMERIAASALRMSNLIDDLLLLSKLESPETTFNMVPLGEVVERVQESLDRSIRESGARVEIGDLPSVFGNQAQLEHLFQNLIANAIKFRRESSPTIRVSAQRGDDGIVVAVSDNGIGFTPDEAERIFQPFTRLHSREKFEGTGLGLAIVARIAEQHGGRVWAKSNPGEGSTFYTLFPRVGRFH